jgi:putative membrane protein
MKYIPLILTGFVAIEHLYILWLEMFAWTTRGKKTFTSVPAELFEKTKVIAANQGLYNGFLAAGLIWSLLITNADWSGYVATFFLSCVVIAGVYGGVTVDKKIFLVQAMPAMIALVVQSLML